MWTDVDEIFNSRRSSSYTLHCAPYFTELLSDLIISVGISVGISNATGCCMNQSINLTRWYSDFLFQKELHQLTKIKSRLSRLSMGTKKGLIISHILRINSDLHWRLCREIPPLLLFLHPSLYFSFNCQNIWPHLSLPLFLFLRVKMCTWFREIIRSRPRVWSQWSSFLHSDCLN